MKRVLNIGSLNIDRCYDVADFVHAKETVSALGYATNTGGKGLNQSVALARAGAQVSHAGAVGEDGEMLLQVLRDSGVDTGYILRVTGPSGHAIIQIDPRGQNCILIYAGANAALDEAYVDRVLSDFAPGDILLLQNETTSVAYAMEQGKKKGMYMVLNPSPIDAALLEYPIGLADLLILNEVEGAALSGEAEFEAILRRLGEKYPDTAVVLTLGEQGCLYRSGDTVLRQAAFRVQAVDTTAAGDTFNAGLAAGLAMGWPLRDAVRLANAAGALAVTAYGAQEGMPSLEQAQALMARG